MKRFKIDFYDSSFAPFALYVRKTCWHTRWTGVVRWDRLDRFPTKDECMALYEKIKGLPEYLD